MIDKVETQQHAYLPKRSIGTAWKEILPLLESSQNIYEFDLTGFFPSVDLEYNRNRLLELGVPASIANHFLALNKSLVKLTDDDKMDESDTRMVIFNTDMTLNENLSKDMLQDLEGVKDLEDQAIKKYLDQGYKLQTVKGVPQGAATSCGLSTLNLDQLYKNNPGLIMYADDGLAFPSSVEEPPLSCEAAGVTQNHEKSGWKKVDGH